MQSLPQIGDIPQRALSSYTDPYPPETNPIEPSLPDAISYPTEAPLGVTINKASFSFRNGRPLINLKRGDCMEVELAIRFQDKNRQQLYVSAELTDSSGKVVDATEILSPIWVYGNTTVTFSLQIPSFASLGTAKISLSLWTTWKWAPNADQYGFNISESFNIVG